MTCLVCAGPADCYWPVIGRPHCRRCVAEARAFLDESKSRHPSFSSHAAGCECEKCAPQTATVHTAESLHAEIMAAGGEWLRV